MSHRPARLDLPRYESNMKLTGALKVTVIAGERGKLLNVLQAKFGKPVGFFPAKVSGG